MDQKLTYRYAMIGYNYQKIFFNKREYTGMDSVIVAVYNCNNFNTFYLFTRFICWFKCQANLGLVENWIVNLKS
jgi:hypothetical protein